MIYTSIYILYDIYKPIYTCCLIYTSLYIHIVCYIQAYIYISCKGEKKASWYWLRLWKKWQWLGQGYNFPLTLSLKVHLADLSATVSLAVKVILAACPSLARTKWQIDRIEEWKNDNLREWDNDIMTENERKAKWQNGRMTKRHNDTMAQWQNDRVW